MKMQHKHTEMPVWPNMQTEVNLHDVISRTSGTNVDRSQRLCKIFEPYLVHSSRNRRRGSTCQIHLSRKSKMAVSAILNFEKSLWIGWRYFHQIWWKDASRPWRWSQVLKHYQQLQDGFQPTCTYLIALATSTTYTSQKNKTPYSCW